MTFNADKLHNIKSHIKNDSIDLKIVAKMFYGIPLYNNKVGRVFTGEVVVNHDRIWRFLDDVTLLPGPLAPFLPLWSGPEKVFCRRLT